MARTDTKKQKQQKCKRGGGIINTLINKLPFEAHLPGYRFCGPGTRLKERLARGDRGINPLDEACRDHDIAYSHSNQLSDRHSADRILADKAWQRVRAKDASFGEKAAALAVTGIMKAKTKVGMGSIRRVQSKPKQGNAITDTMKVKTKVGMGSKRRRKCKRVKVGRSIKHTQSIPKRRTAQRHRILKTPKRGGFLPLLLPILGALGSLAGGGAAIAKAVKDSQAAKTAQAEQMRHNREMERLASGKGLYLEPYRRGRGLYLKKNYR